MIKCNKCSGKVFVDLMFTGTIETFCLHCGKRTFIGSNHPQFELFADFVKRATTG